MKNPWLDATLSVSRSVPSGMIGCLATVKYDLKCLANGNQLCLTCTVLVTINSNRMAVLFEASSFNWQEMTIIQFEGDKFYFINWNEKSIKRRASKKKKKTLLFLSRIFYAETGEVKGYESFVKKLKSVRFCKRTERIKLSYRD